MKSLLLSLVQRTELPGKLGTSDDFRIAISSNFNGQFVLSSQSKSSMVVTLFVYFYDEKVANNNNNISMNHSYIHEEDEEYLTIDPSEFYSSGKENHNLVNTILDPTDESVLIFFSSGLAIAVGKKSPPVALGIIEGGVSHIQASPDHEVFSIFVQNGQTLLLLAMGTLDTISRISLNGDGSNRPISQPISVGWGSEKTQFRGAGAAAAERATIAKDAQFHKHHILSPACNDGLSSRSLISCHWHPDSSKFALILEDGSLCIYGRDGTFLAKSIHAVSSPGSPMAWKGQYGHGFGIMTPSFDDSHALGIFEPNCLEHGRLLLHQPQNMEAQETATFQISSLAWNGTDTILALGYVHGPVQLWTTTCFHFDLKMELASPPATTILKMFWLDSHENHLIVVRQGPVTIHIDMFVIHMASGAISTPDPNSKVIVSSGGHFRVNPCSFGMVPPPLCRWKASHPDGRAMALIVSNDKKHQMIAINFDASELVLFHEGLHKSAGLGLPMEVSGKIPLSLSPGCTIFPRQLHLLKENLLLLFATIFPNNNGSVRYVLFFLFLGEISSSNKAECPYNIEAWRMVDIPTWNSVPSSVHICDDNNTVLIHYVDGSLAYCFLNYMTAITSKMAPILSQDDGFPGIIEAMDRVGIIDQSHHGIDVQWRLLEKRMDANDMVIQSQFSSCRSMVLLLTHRGTLWLVTNANHLRHLNVEGVTSIALFGNGKGLSNDPEPPLRVLVTLQRSQAACTLSLYELFGDEGEDFKMLECRPCEPGSTILTVSGGEPTPVTLLVMNRGSLERIYMRTLLLEHMAYLCEKERCDFRSAYEMALRHRLPLARLIPIAKDEQQGNAQDSTQRLKTFIEVLTPDQLIQIMADRSVTTEHRAVLKAGVLSKLACHNVGTLRVAIAADLLSNAIDEAMALLAAEWEGLNSSERILLIRSALVLVSREKVNAGADALMTAALGVYSLELAQAIGEEGLNDRDPQEFMSFISKCHACAKETYRRFLMDDRLGRSERALGWLIVEAAAETGHDMESQEKMTTQILTYAMERDLYEPALFHPKSNAALRMAILRSYAQKHPAPRAFLAVGMFKEAAMAFTTQGDYLGAIVAHSLLSSCEISSLDGSIYSTIQQSPYGILLAVVSQLQGHTTCSSDFEQDSAVSMACSAMQLVSYNGGEPMSANDKTSPTSLSGPNDTWINQKTRTWVHGWELALLLCLQHQSSRATQLQEEVLLPALRTEASRLLKLLTTEAMEGLRKIIQGLERHRRLPEVGEFDLVVMGAFDQGHADVDNCSVISCGSAMSRRSKTSTQSGRSASGRSSTSASFAAKAIARKKKAAAKVDSPRHEWHLLNEAKAHVEKVFLPLIPSFFTLVETFLLCIARKLGTIPTNYCTKLKTEQNGDAFWGDFLERLPHALVKAWDENIILLSVILEKEPIKRRISPSSSAIDVEDIFKESLLVHAELRTLVGLLPRNPKGPPISLI